MRNAKKAIVEIDCDEAASRFSDFIDHYLKGKSKEELMHHIAGCRHCFERIEFEQMLKSKVSSLVKETTENKKADIKQLEKILSKIYST